MPINTEVVSSNPTQTRCTRYNICDKVCRWLATGRWFSSCTLVSSTNKTDRHDITEILLKVALNTINQPTITISDRGFITILYCGSWHYQIVDHNNTCITSSIIKVNISCSASLSQNSFSNERSITIFDRHLVIARWWTLSIFNCQSEK